MLSLLISVLWMIFITAACLFMFIPLMIEMILPVSLIMELMVLLPIILVILVYFLQIIIDIYCYKKKKALIMQSALSFFKFVSLYLHNQIYFLTHLDRRYKVQEGR